MLHAMGMTEQEQITDTRWRVTNLLTMNSLLVAKIGWNDRSGTLLPALSIDADEEYISQR